MPNNWMAPWKNRTSQYISFFCPSLSGILFQMFCLLTGRRGMPDFSVLKYYELNIKYSLNILTEYSNRLQTPKPIITCSSVLPPEIVMHDASIGGRSEHNIKCVVHDDLGRKNRTNYYRFSAVSLASQWNIFGSFTEPFSWRGCCAYSVDSLLQSTSQSVRRLLPSSWNRLRSVDWQSLQHELLCIFPDGFFLQNCDVFISDFSTLIDSLLLRLLTAIVCPVTDCLDVSVRYWLRCNKLNFCPKISRGWLSIQREKTLMALCERCYHFSPFCWFCLCF